MKSMYVVTLKVANREVLADIIDAVEGKAESVEVAVWAPQTELAMPAVPRTPRVRKERRSKRGSKVNTAILKAMNDAPASIAALKAALSQAGMAPSSLSTGLATLTKLGQVERVGEGLYGLKVKLAAE